MHFKFRLHRRRHAIHMYQYMHRSARRILLDSRQIALLRPSIPTPRHSWLPSHHQILPSQPFCSIKSSPIFKCELEDAPRTIASSPKWGFVIYRCDYQSDTAWDEFIDGWAALVKSQVREQYNNSDKLVQTLDFTVRDDRPTLDGASIAKVRMLHEAWAESEEIEAEQLEITRTGAYTLWRYGWCVHVDTASLNSCLEYLRAWRRERHSLYMNPYVNVVQTGYPGLLSKEQKESYAEQLRLAQQEADEEGWDSSDELPVSIKAHLSFVLPELYGSNENCFDVLQRESARDPQTVICF